MAEITKNSELPSPLQVDSNKALSLNGGEERVFTVKNHRGDWCAIKGHWEGFRLPRAGIPGTANKRGVPGQPGAPGQLILQCWYNTDQDEHRVSKWTKLDSKRVKIKDKNVSMQFTTGKVYIDWATSSMKFGSKQNVEHLPEMIALAFCIPNLWVILQPRRVSDNFDIPSEKVIKVKVDKYQETKVIEKRLVDYPLLTDCGYYYPVPYCYTSDFSIVK